jgi:F0F1-type ATP synthase assembly protein I
VVTRVLLLQLGVTAVAALLFLVLSGSKASLSALTGGLVCFLAGLPYALRVASTRPASAMHALWVHGLGELSKVAFTLVALAVIFTRYGPEVSAVPLLVTYISATLSYWVALISP